MNKREIDVAIIGAGPAGLAAALSARKNNAKDVMIIDRNKWLGGILPQCIHDGFGVEEIGVSMTGPEYADIYIKKLIRQDVKILTETMVLKFDKNLNILATNKNGIQKICAKSIILAMGAREKTRWNIMIPGDRPSGIFTAGTAQAFINLYNIMPARNVLILGSGDVGLIMARRLKFEGVNVLGVVEILPFASGLPRNIVQCLDDYDIPIYLNHTVTYIKGKERLESVTIAKVNENGKILSETEIEIKCDTLLLSLGLIPENELSKEAGIKIDHLTGGPIVNQYFETNIKGVFACGNCLQIYDTVDTLSIDAKKTGLYATKYINNDIKYDIKVIAGKGIRYIIPQHINKYGSIEFSLRVLKPQESVNLKVYANDKGILNKKFLLINPANLVRFKLDISKETLKSTKKLVVKID